MATELEYLNFANKIDHSVLNPGLSEKEAVESIKVAGWYRTKSVIVRPFQIPLAKVHSGYAEVISTIGFPHGGQTTRVKCEEALALHGHRSIEADMVMNIGEFKSRHYKYVEDEIIRVKNSLNNLPRSQVESKQLPSGSSNHFAGSGFALKVIIEVGHLTDQEISDACKLVEQAGGDMVKTSTGYGPRYPTLKDIEIMRNSVSSAVGVKAAGGIRTLESALAMIDAGADRLGLTATKKILDDYRESVGLQDLGWDDEKNKAHEFGDSTVHNL